MSTETIGRSQDRPNRNPQLIAQAHVCRRKVRVERATERPPSQQPVRATLRTWDGSHRRLFAQQLDTARVPGGRACGREGYR
jgi:hypothetical protein